MSWVPVALVPLRVSDHDTRARSSHEAIETGTTTK
jgi:hypothetical protein